jgi:hypothetical protein
MLLPLLLTPPPSLTCLPGHDPLLVSVPAINDAAGQVLVALTLSQPIKHKPAAAAAAAAASEQTSHQVVFISIIEPLIPETAPAGQGWCCTW